MAARSRLGRRVHQDGTALAVNTATLVALYGVAIALTCTINFAMAPGTCFLLLDHSRTELGQELVTIGATISLDDAIEPDGDEQRVGGRPYRVTCVPSGVRSTKSRSLGRGYPRLVQSLRSSIDTRARGQREARESRPGRFRGTCSCGCMWRTSDCPLARRLRPT